VTSDSDLRRTKAAEPEVETVSGSAQATFGRTYDRNGWVRSETQTLVSVPGDAGAGTQSFDYDNLGRVISSSIPGSSNNKAYSYDADSNRLTQTENGVTASFAYDRTDELTTLTIDGVVKNEVYDAYGNLTTSVTPDAKKADTQAPTVPTGVSATAISPTQVNLAWTASTDDQAVVRYTIYRGGSLLSVGAGALTSFTDRSTNKNTAYAYTVSASDAAGNTSAVSSAANVTTPNGNVPSDTTAPTVPTGLSVTAVSNTQLNLAWTASTDANGVQGLPRLSRRLTHRHRRQQHLLGHRAHPLDRLFVHRRRDRWRRQRERPGQRGRRHDLAIRR
jgi:chitodextrinase